MAALEIINVEPTYVLTLTADEAAHLRGLLGNINSLSKSPLFAVWSALDRNGVPRTYSHSYQGKYLNDSL